MPITSTDSVDALHLPNAVTGAFAAGPSEIERQVLNYFDHFRDSLLRYVLAFGLPVHDGEEIIQEVFLALFCQLQRGKSRQNLQGWIFRVAVWKTFTTCGRSLTHPRRGTRTSRMHWKSTSTKWFALANLTCPRRSATSPQTGLRPTKSISIPTSLSP